VHVTHTTAKSPKSHKIPNKFPTNSPYPSSSKQGEQIPQQKHGTLHMWKITKKLFVFCTSTFVFTLGWVLTSGTLPHSKGLKFDTNFLLKFYFFPPVMPSRYLLLGMMGTKKKNNPRCSIRVSPNTLRKMLKVFEVCFIEFPSVLAI
jgi:hypothetical protein